MIAPLPDHCLLIPFSIRTVRHKTVIETKAIADQTAPMCFRYSHILSCQRDVNTGYYLCCRPRRYCIYGCRPRIPAFDRVVRLSIHDTNSVCSKQDIKNQRK